MTFILESAEAAGYLLELTTDYTIRVTSPDKTVVTENAEQGAKALIAAIYEINELRENTVDVDEVKYRATVLQQQLEEGKYTIHVFGDGTTVLTRHGETWIKKADLEFASAWRAIASELDYLRRLPARSTAR